MIITFILDGNISPFSVDVADTEEVNTLKQLVAAEFKIDFDFDFIAEGRIIRQGHLLQNSLKSGDIILVQRKQTLASSAGSVTASASSASAASAVLSLTDIPVDVTPDGLINIVKENPSLLSQIMESDPTLGNAISRSDIQELRRYLMARYLALHKKKYERDMEMNKIAANPDSEENQKLIAERIREENIRENMELAMENIPESFTQVNMLYINCQINDNDIRAFVDSGAQSTIMSAKCVERCGLSRLVDVRYAGEARGVGTGKIIGRIHIAQMRLGQSFFPVSITVLETSDVEFLFGLDMLKRHRCCIDLGNSELRIEGHSGVERIPFV